MSADRQSITSAWRNPKVRLYALIFLFVGAGVDVSRVARDTFFLQTAGSDHIPWVYVLFAGIMILSSVVYGRAAKRFPINALATITLCAAAVVIVGEWLCIALGYTGVALAYIIFCSVEMAFIFVPLTVWAVANQVFQVEEGEVHLPSIATFGLIGTVTGGLCARFSVPFIGPYNILLGAGAAFVVACLLSKRIVLPALSGEQSTRKSEVSTRTQGLRTPWSEAIVKTLTFLAFPLWVLVYMIEYLYYAAADQTFSDAAALSSFLSLFVAACSMAALLVQLYLTPWLIQTFGVGATCAMYPMALAVGAVSTLVFGLSSDQGMTDGAILSLPFLSVVFARFLDMAMYQSIYESTIQVLYYAVPARTRTQARAFVGGIIFPASIAVAGGLLMIFRYGHEPLYNVSFTAVVIGFLVVIIAMDIRPDYLRSLLTHSDPNNVALRTALLVEISHLSGNESRGILVRSLVTSNADEAMFAARRLVETFEPTLIEDLEEVGSQIAPSVAAVLIAEVPSAYQAEMRRALGNES